MEGSRASHSHLFSDHPSDGSVADRVERILAIRNLTLSEVSRTLRLRYAGMPRYFVPHNFYYDLGLPHYSPRVEQVLALSRVSGFRLTDWFAVFGFKLDDIPRLQVEFPSTYTHVLDDSSYDRAAWINWFEDAGGDSAASTVAPLGRLLTPAHSRRIDLLLANERSPFLYAKIGSQDALAFPDLLPGSIVRADTRGIGELLRSIENNNFERLFLVEHGQRVVCSRLHFQTKGKLTLRATTLPFAQTELRLGSNARVLGVLDWELRPSNTARPEVPTASMKFLNQQTLSTMTGQPGLHELLERARLRSGLSIRKASAKSRWISHALRDERYFCSPGSLTEFETRPRLPAHIHKIMSLCVLYSLKFWDLLAAAGLDSGDSGQEPIPDELIGRPAPDSAPTTNAVTDRSTKQTHFLASLVADFQEIPLFLRHSLSAVAGLAGLSLRDVFWVGGRTGSLHSYLKDALFVALNRRLKKPVFLKQNSLWEQPLYILLLRDGTYLIGGCSVEGSTLVLHPFADGVATPQTFRYRVDAEVVGKVSAIFRRLR